MSLGKARGGEVGKGGRVDEVNGFFFPCYGYLVSIGSDIQEVCGIGSFNQSKF